MPDPNELYLKKLGKQGSPFRILLSKKPEYSAQPGDAPVKLEPKPGLMHVRHRPKRLLIPRKKGGFINFYDLGYFIPEEGDPYTRDTGITKSERDDNTYADDLRDFYNYPLEVDLNEWVTRFGRVTTEYKFRASFTKDSEVVNEDADFLDSENNSNWTTQGYRLDSTFNGIEVGDLNSIFNQFQSTSSSSSLRITASIDPEDDDIYLPELDPTEAPINIFLSPRVLAIESEEQPEHTGADITGDPEEVYPAYNLVSPACPPLTDEQINAVGWSRALVWTGNSYSDSGTYYSSESEKFTTLDRDTALNDLVVNSEEDTPETYELGNYIAENLDVDYEQTDWSQAGQYFASRAKYSGNEPELGNPPGTTYIGRNYICLDGATYEATNDLYVIHNAITSSSSSTSPTSPFEYDEESNLQIQDWVLSGNTATGEGGALLAAINQGENWYFIWHLTRYVEF